MFIQQKQFAISAETEVCAATRRKVYFANELSSWRPYMDAISTTAVNIPQDITFDAIRNAHSHKSKQSFVHQKWGAVSMNDIKREAIGDAVQLADVIYHTLRRFGC